MKTSLLNRINYGYSDIEPIVTSLMAVHKNFMLIGKHGAGKTRISKELSRGFGERGFIFYDATKDDLITIAGIPDSNSLQNGKLKFSSHERTIWDKTTIVVDEITRAGKESQNLWLEIIEEKTCFGIPLSYRTLIATANPESYAAAFQLDDALLDRFYAVIPVPELQAGIREDQILEMLGLTFNTENNSPKSEELARFFSEIQTARIKIMESEEKNKVMSYTSSFISVLLKKLVDGENTYISPRTYSRNFPETILAVSAYFNVMGETEYLEKGAREAFKYCLSTKLKIPPQILEFIHQETKNRLRKEALTEAEKLRISLNLVSGFEEGLTFLQNKWKEILEIAPRDEVDKIIGSLFGQASKVGEKEKLVRLRSVLDSLGYRGDVFRKLDGSLILTLNNSLNTIMPVLNKIVEEKKDKKHLKVIEKINHIKHLIDEGKFISNSAEPILAFKTFIIDVWEGDKPKDIDSVIEIINSIDIPLKE
jgi:hypothetical protein